MAYRAYVGNLPFTFSKVDLEQLFQGYGQVKSVEIVSDRETGRSRGFGFVEMNTHEALQAAMAALNGKPIGGRSLTVNEARERDARGPSAPRSDGGYRTGPPRSAPSEARGANGQHSGAGFGGPHSAGPRSGRPEAGTSNGGSSDGRARKERENDRSPRRGRGIDDYDRHDKSWLRGLDER